MRAVFDHITRDLETLYSYYSDEEILERLGVPLKKGKFCSPFRKDNNPTCNVWRSPNGRLMYRDWAIHDRPVDVVGLAMELHNCNFPEAVKKLWELVDSTYQGQITIVYKNTKVFKESTVYDLKAIPRSWESKDLQWWQSFGITEPTLDKYKVKPASKVIESGKKGPYVSYVYGPKINPAYIYEFSDSLKVYFPLNKRRRFVHSKGDIIQGYDQLPDEGRDLVITKSLKDCACLSEMNISAIAPQSETTPINDKVFSELKQRFNNIFIFYDNDEAGMKNAKKMSEELDIPYIYLSTSQSKDISDYVRKVGMEEARRFMEMMKNRVLDA